MLEIASQIDFFSPKADLNEYEMHLQCDRHLQSETIKHYIASIKEFKKYTTLDDLAQASRDHVRRYLTSLEERGITKCGIANYITALRSFYNWLSDKTGDGQVIKLAFFMTNIIKIKRYKNIVFVPTQDDVTRFRKTFEAYKQAAQITQNLELYNRHLREIAAIELLITGGFRSNELRHIYRRDVNMNESTVDIRKGKGGHQRVSLFGGSAHKALQEYFDHYKLHDGDILFPYKQGNVLNIVIKSWAKRAVVDTKIHAHSFRHYFITESQRQGVPLEDVAQQVGHVNLNTTRTYTHLNTAVLKDRFRNCVV